ncbi:MAG: aminotransferase class V-fold PLP-dependent enzyme [Thermodesulfobacteriota bacterium]
MNTGKSSRESRRGICGICPAGCWVRVSYDHEGRIVRLEPDTDPIMGITCKLAEHVHDIVYSPHRLLYPMKRKGCRGSYDFERITWGQAFDEIVANLERIKAESGPQASAIYTGVGCFEQGFCDIFQPAGVLTSSASSVLFPYGSPNTMGVGALCYVSYGMMAPHLTTGKILPDMFNDIENSELVVVWGANPATDLPPIDMKRILTASRRGAEVIVIDPQKTATAKLTGAQWIPIRPGTDGALALALCNILIEEELYDEEFASDWTFGFEEFSCYVQHFPPEAVQDITGVPAEEIRNLAHTLAAANGASQYMYTGMEYSNSGVQAIRAALVLWALAGQLDVPGGRCFIMKGNRFPINRKGLVKSPEDIRKLGEDWFPLYVHYRGEAHPMALPQAVLEGKPYPVRALMVVGSSMITSWPHPPIWRKTFENLDFMVCVDRQLTADAAYADIVLPASTYFEIDSYMTYGPHFRLREKMIEPVGESRGDISIMAELASRLGYGHLYPQNADQLYDYILDGSGFTIDDVHKAGGMVSADTEIMQYKKWQKGLLREDGRPGFDTPSGKFEIHSLTLEEFGYDPLPVYTEPAEGPLSRPDLTDAYPLVFNSGARVRTSFHTQHHGVPGLVRERPEPTVTVHRIDAESRGIKQGDMAAISTPHGKIAMRAEVTDDIAPGMIQADHACGSPVGPKEWSEKNINELTSLQNHDPITGFPVYKCLLCQVERIEEKSRTGACSPDISEQELGEPSPEEIEEIYLDHNATTPISEEVQRTIEEFLIRYGNPSSIHRAGRRARSRVDESRRSLASALHCTTKRIIFTGSGSEAINLAIKGTALRSLSDSPHFITTQIEHPATVNAFMWLEKFGCTVTVLPVGKTGLVDPDDFSRAINDRTVLASIMLANNETGTIQPIREMAIAARDRGVLFHCDAVQGLGKIPVDVENLEVDMLSVSGHKMYGPKGVGALYCRKGVQLEPLISGGGQESGLRSGTENTLGIVAMGKASEMLGNYLDKMETVEKLRDQLEQGILSLFEGSFVNGLRAPRLPNTSNITVPGFRGESLVTALSRRGIYISSGSACKAGSTRPSAALLALGLTEDQAHCSIRISLGGSTTQDNIDKTLQVVEEIIARSGNTVQFAPCR